jgi:hypothetical protein
MYSESGTECIRGWCEWFEEVSREIIQSQSVNWEVTYTVLSEV